jgi:LDH2 family malate/lactate/ureidoglycolate dehydrogenase
MLFECLTSLFVANPLLTPVFQGKPGAQVHGQNSVVAAVDIATFTDLAEYKANADAIVDGIKALPTAEGFRRSWCPGSPKTACRRNGPRAASRFRRAPSSR